MINLEEKKSHLQNIFVLLLKIINFKTIDRGVNEENKNNQVTQKILRD